MLSPGEGSIDDPRHQDRRHNSELPCYVEKVRAVVNDRRTDSPTRRRMRETLMSTLEYLPGETENELRLRRHKLRETFRYSGVPYQWRLLPEVENLPTRRERFEEAARERQRERDENTRAEWATSEYNRIGRYGRRGQKWSELFEQFRSNQLKQLRIRGGLLVTADGEEILGTTERDLRMWEEEAERRPPQLTRVLGACGGGGGGGGGGGASSSTVRPRPSSGPYMTIARLCRAESNKPNEYERDLMKRRGLTFKALLELEELQEALEGGGPNNRKAVAAELKDIRRWCCNNNCNKIATLCDCRECCDLLDKGDWGEGPRYGAGGADYGPPNRSYGRWF